MLLTCLLAGMPTSLWPSSVKATVEGVVLIPTGHGDHEGGPFGWRWLTFSVLDDPGVVSFHDCNTRVCGSKINTNNAILERIRSFDSVMVTQSFFGLTGRSGDQLG